MAGMAGMTGMGSPADSGSVLIDRSTSSRFGISFARASEQPLSRKIRLAGTLAYAEPNRVYVNARVSGWVEKLFADYAGKPVQVGQALLSLYSPELVGAQEEYLSARRLGDSALVSAARRRLVLWNISADQIERLERSGTVERAVEIRAPRSGEIAEKMVTEGQAVSAGDNLFLIADRSVLWVDLAIFEMDAALVRMGSPVELTVDILPGRTYRGTITFIQPTVDSVTRSLTARVEVRSGDGALRPGMFATAVVTPARSTVLTIPAEAALPTGTRTIAFVNRGDGRFMPREITTGVRGDSLIEVLSGLRAGDEVVASATYLLDSESNLAAAMQGLMLRMGMGLNMGGMPATPAEEKP
jgi:Cu(I)/Ag(I) efflux system membrane fusion protein